MEPGRTIYYNGDIVTMEGGGADSASAEAVYIEAVCIEGGRICKAGPLEEVLAWDGQGGKMAPCASMLPSGSTASGTRMVDLEGKAMFPGFIDGHSHFAGVANSLRLADLGEAKSLCQVAQALIRFKEEQGLRPGQWIQGRQYDHNFLLEKRHPDRHLLDQVSMEHPILISHASGHMGVANTMALKVMGITRDTPDPDGGKYAREEGSGEPTGYMEENAFISFQNQVPMVEPGQMDALLGKAQDLYASYGITTIQDGMVAAPLLDIYDRAVDKGTLWLDVAGYLDLKDSHELLARCQRYRDGYVNHFRIGGYKIFLDGSPQGRTAWMLDPYEGGEEGYRGYPALRDSQVGELVRQAARDGMQLLAHCNGDGAAEQYITQIEQAMARGQADARLRPVMIHAQLVTGSQLERMVPIHMTPSFFVAHTYYWGDIHRKNFGKERADRISPAHTAQKLGLSYTFHQDSPVLPPDMMKTLWCAVNRKTREGVSIGEGEAVSPYQAMKAITVYGACQYGEEDQKGTIQEGKAADLVILDRNPFKVPKGEIDQVKVVETIKEGKVVYNRLHVQD